MLFVIDKSSDKFSDKFSMIGQRTDKRGNAYNVLTLRACVRACVCACVCFLWEATSIHAWNGSFVRSESLACPRTDKPCINMCIHTCIKPCRSWTHYPICVEAIPVDAVAATPSWPYFSRSMNITVSMCMCVCVCGYICSWGHVVFCALRLLLLNNSESLNQVSVISIL